MKILIKIPTRERGYDFLKPWQELSDLTDTQIWLTLDDPDLHQRTVEDPPVNVNFIRGKSENKIHAYNRDIDIITRDHFPDWDILIAGSDDMEPLVKGYDRIIANDMANSFPDTDGALWYPTENQEEFWGRVLRKKIRRGSEEYMRRCINTLPIIGRKYYDRFGYVYYPEYKGFYCDNEFTNIAVTWGKIKFIDQDIITHNHPTWIQDNSKYDKLYIRTTSKHFKRDGILYRKRMRQGFPNVVGNKSFRDLYKAEPHNLAAYRTKNKGRKP